MDYAHRRRVKLWGRARVVEDDPALLARLWPEGYKARDEQVILFELEAWDTNCPQHIPQMFHAEDVGAHDRAVPGAHQGAGGGGGGAEGSATGNLAKCDGHPRACPTAVRFSTGRVPVGVDRA